MKNLALIFIILSAISCQKEIDKMSTYSLKGKVEKGAFIKGSKVTIHELDEKLTPTGKAFTSSIVDDEGSFLLGDVALNSPYVELTGDGYYYNEVEGELSSGQISLHALADVRESRSVNINLITHITKERVKYLMKRENSTFKQANRQAQKEFLTSFALQQYSDKDANSFSISSGTNEASALIVISSSLLKGKTDAAFTEFIAKLTNHFKVNGAFSDEDKAKITEDSRQLNFSFIARMLIERYKTLHKEISVKELRYFVDWNNDGIAGNELGDMGNVPSLTFEKNELIVGTQGGAYKIKINSNILYQIATPKNPNLSIDDNRAIKGLLTPIKCTTEIEASANELTLTVTPSGGAWMKDTLIVIQSYDKMVQDTLIVRQEGDSNKVEASLNAITDMIGQSTGKAFDYNHTAEAFYSGCYQTSVAGWLNFCQHNVDPSSTLLNTIWKNNYTVINQINALLDIDLPDTLSSALSLLRSILYYEMVVLWGNIVYIDSGNHSNPNKPQTSENELYNLLIGELKKRTNILPERAVRDTFPHEKHILNAMLAKLLLHDGKFQEAASLLEEIVSSDLYFLNGRPKFEIKKESPEMIYFVSFLTNAEYQYNSLVERNAEAIPVLTYREVLLMASECYYRLGNNTKAMHYLNLIETAAGRAQKITIDTQDIQQTWKSELAGQFSYFAFLKRNGLVQGTLTIPTYKNVLPIPLKEIMVNPYITQNPGY